MEIAFARVAVAFVESRFGEFQSPFHVIKPLGDPSIISNNSQFARRSVDGVADAQVVFRRGFQQPAAIR